MGQRGYTKLHDAAQSGNLDEVRVLLRAGKNPNHFDEGGCTPLHYAAEAGHAEVVKELLSSGVDVNAQDEEAIGNTAISHIAGNCSLAMAALLIEAGANPNLTGWMQLNALDRAKDRKRGDGPAVYGAAVRGFAKVPEGTLNRHFEPAALQHRLGPFPPAGGAS